ncbi:histidine kinase [Streptomyces sp. Je 1-79]|uniref:sensor histidine kinase n=1 Tax=Streptomyces sp. Je 1-79 TaxID=2943847 RepID=UPI0021A5C12A|nr:histidine kinase [Streptomyces sp. Je 1-79]MCT4357114.1 histidine kinase [Streptomyces sp. Je 1-79]
MVIGRMVVAAVVPGAAVLGLVVRRRRGTTGAAGTATAAGAAGVVSLTVTAGTWVFGRLAETDRWPALLGLVELGVLLALVAVALRGGRGWTGPVAAGTAGLGVALWPARFEALDEPGDLLTFAGFGAVLVVPAALAGLYLRGLDTSRRRSVAAARRAQRLELAHDLHDFVAHDVSGMVALAQAGTVLATSDPSRAAALFERIEQAGQQALGSLDRTVHLLRTPEENQGVERVPQPGLGELATLIRRFDESGEADVRLEPLPEGAQVPREVAATAYRIVVEALTNVRRHAPAARAVTVRVCSADGRLYVTVDDDGPGDRATGSRRGGGSGLAGLAARVEALSGTLTAARTDGGWRVAATMPLEGR